nr:hypothetical protein [Tanacetum cinerariifolium]
MQFDELPFEEVILIFLKELGLSGEIKMITDVNINKLHQPCRSFAAVINKCLSGKSTGYDSLRLSQAQILWGMYYKKNIYFSYLLWEDFVYQVKQKDAKKSNEMYYPRFTKVIVNFFMTKDQSILRRNKYGAILPNELTNEAIKNPESYKEYYAIASGAEPSKTKASVKKKQVSFDTTMPPPNAKGKRLKTSANMDKPAKEKQPVKTTKAKGLTVLSVKSSKEDDDEEVNVSKHDDDVDDQSDDDDENDDDDDDDQDDDDNQDDDDEETNSDSNGDDFVHTKFSTHNDEDKEEESFDPIVQTPSHVENTDDEDNDEDSHDKEEESFDPIVQTHSHVENIDDEENDKESYGMNVEGDELDDEGSNEEDNGNELSRDVNINLEGIDSIFNLNTESTSRVDVPVTTTAEPPLLSLITLPPPSTSIITHLQQTPVPSPVNVPSSSLQDLPNFGSLFGFDHRLKALEVNFSEFMQTNQFAEAISLILGIVDKLKALEVNFSEFMQTNQFVETISSIPGIVDKDEAQAKNEDFLKKLDENIKKLIKEQVKEQVQAQVYKILPKIKKTVNEQLKAEVLNCSSNSSKISHAVAANLSELEIKKILIDKIESNKSIHRSDEQKNLYKALVDAYEFQTPSHVENTDDEDNDEDSHDAQQTNVLTTKETKDTHVIITPVNPEGQQQSSYVSSRFILNMLNPSPDTCIDSIFNLNTESTSQVDVSVTTTAELPLLSTTTLPPPTTPIISHLQQTSVPLPVNVPSLSLQVLPNFGSLFGFDHRLKALEVNFLEFMHTNQFAEAISSIPDIVDKYLDKQMNEAVKVAVQLQSDRLRYEAQAENEYFLNKLDENIKKIFKEQVKAQVSMILLKIKKTVNEQLKAEVLTRLSNSSETSHDVAASQSKLELKKIIIDKMESNKSIHRSDEQKNLYKALVDAYEFDKLILNTYEDTVTLKRRRNDEDKDETPSLNQTGGPREEYLEKNSSLLVHQRRRLLCQPKSQLKGPNHIISLLASLL